MRENVCHLSFNPDLILSPLLLMQRLFYMHMQATITGDLVLRGWLVGVFGEEIVIHSPLGDRQQCTLLVFTVSYFEL